MTQSMDEKRAADAYLNHTTFNRVSDNIIESKLVYYSLDGLTTK